MMAHVGTAGRWGEEGAELKAIIKCGGRPLGGAAQSPKALSALAEDQAQFPTPTWQLTTVCISSFR